MKNIKIFICMAVTIISILPIIVRPQLIRSAQLYKLSEKFYVNQVDVENHKPELKIQYGHQDSVSKVVFSPDGKFIVSASSDNSIRVWDTNNGQEVKVYEYYGGNFEFVSNDFLLVTNKDKIDVINLITGQRIVDKYKGHGTYLEEQDDDAAAQYLEYISTASQIAVSGDKRLIATGSQKNSSIIVSEFETGSLVKYLNIEETIDPQIVEKGCDARIDLLNFSSDGTKVIAVSSIHNIRISYFQSCDTNSYLRIFDLQSNTWVTKITLPTHRFAQYDRIRSGFYLVLENGNELKFYDLESKQFSETYNGNDQFVRDLNISSDGKQITALTDEAKIIVWNIGNSNPSKTYPIQNSEINTIDVSIDKTKMIFGDDKGEIFLSNNMDGTVFWSNKTHVETVKQMKLSRDKSILVNLHGGKATVWNLNSGELINVFPIETSRNKSVFMDKDNKTLLIGSSKNIFIYDIQSGNLINQIRLKEDLGVNFETYEEAPNEPAGVDIANVALSPNKGYLVVRIDYYGEEQIIVWDIRKKIKIRDFIAENTIIENSSQYVITSTKNELDWKPPVMRVWNSETGQLLCLLKPEDDVKQTSIENLAVVSHNKKVIAIQSRMGDVNFFNLSTGKFLLTKQLYSWSEGIYADSVELNSLEFSQDDKKFLVGKKENNTIIFNVNEEILDFDNQYNTQGHIASYLRGEELIIAADRTSITVRQSRNAEELFKLIFFDNNDWVVVSPNGRFDASNLDLIKSAGWVIPAEPNRAFSIELYMRQFYEPNLMQRTFRCNEENSCDKEFKPLPSIAEINRVQPKVVVKEIKPVANSVDLANITIEVENITEDVSISATDRTKKKQLSSGAFDLRLFRDGQLVGVSAPKEKLEKFIGDAARLVEETRASGKLINTPEDLAWREANDVFKLTGENVKKVSANKIEYNFRNVRLPKGQTSVDFTAYAFNSDKVKSTTTEPFKFEVPKTIAAIKKKGRAFVVSIGVNASENPAYNLKYAANDARKMQEIVGSRLKADNEQYSEVIQIPLVSDHDADGNLSENAAQKAVIKGVFSLLEGRTLKDVSAEISKENPQLANVLKNIPNVEKIKAVEPEDTLIITYAGHGYADQSGIFYLLPYDIGKDTRQLTTEALQKTISSDELSLWMQDITASEMIFIIDACHSSAAVQGDGFKPGPMGSRGLGQLAYDKDMKILSATQADNVALELGSLQQGLLSYALLEDGIVKSLADANKDKKLLPDEWLNYAEKRVPELYAEVKDGKRGIIIDGKKIKAVTNRSDIEYLDGSDQKSSLNLQQPSLFDFKRRNTKNTLLVLQ